LANLDPGVAHYVDALQRATADWPAPETPAQDRRRAERVARVFATPLPRGMRTEHDTLCLDGRELPIRRYHPRGVPSGGRRPTLIHFHGGGWVVGSVDTHHGIVADLAEMAGVQAISVGYRRAPENPYPAPLDDCFEAVGACVADPDLGVDPDRIALCGDSAGGNLALATAMRCRDAGGLVPRFLGLFYPVLDADLDTASYRNALDPLLDRDSMRYYLEAYLGDLGQTDGYALPLRADDLSSLPPTYLLAAELDPLRDEAETLARRLVESGVACVWRTLPGTTHSFLRARRESDLIRAEVRGLCAALAEALDARRDVATPAGSA